MDECQYHRHKTPSWHCEGCHRYFCTQCVPGGEDNFRRGQPRCVLCSQPLNWLGDGARGVPFWQRSGQILRYGLTPPAIWLILLYATLSVLDLNLIGALLLLLVAMMLSVYSLFVIARVAEDDWQPPLPADALSEGGLFLKQIALMLVLFGAPGVLLATGSPVMALGLLALAALVMPAAVMLLAITHSLRTALNPLRWLQLIVTVGASYLLLWIAVMTVVGAPSLLEHLGHHPIVLFMSTLFSAYTMLLSAAMMGALLNQHGRALGLGADSDRGHSLPEQDYDVAEALGSAHVYASEGRFEEALGVINRALNAVPMHQELNQRRLRLLGLLNKDTLWQEQLVRFCRQLMSRGNSGTAVQVWLEARQQQPAFRPDDPALSLSLAQALSDRGRLKEAGLLLVNMHRRSPDFDKLGDAYMLLARVYLEEQDDQGMAGKLIEFVRQRFPQQFDSEEARQTRQIFTQLQQAAG
ncbi:MAG: hypothetical protein R3292_03030 [Alcanivorax sp.]|nr:hypothetical protein [Alcanivorax sp.]